MRVLLAAAVFGLLSLPARADITDPGSLTIGSQGIFGGTATVQGNAFSVGGSSLVVANGNAGVGTSTPAERVEIKSDGLNTYPLILTTRDFNNGTFGSGLLLGMGATGGNTYGVIAAQSAGLTAWNNLVLQSGGGNVGVGTASPLATLHVAGTASITGPSTFQATVTVIGSGLSQPMVRFHDTGAASNPAVQVSNDVQNWNFQTVGARNNRLELFNATAGGAAANSYITATTGGKIGIGSTASGDPNAVLTVVGDSAVSGPATFGSSVTVRANGAAILINDTANNPVITLQESGTQGGKIQTAGRNIYIDGGIGGNNILLNVNGPATGKVGVGTASPTSPLDVKTSGAVGLGVHAIGNDAFVRIYHTGASGILDATYDSSAGYTPMRLGAGGNFNETLETSGATTFSSSVTVQGNSLSVAGTISGSTAVYAQNPWLGLGSQVDTTTVGGLASVFSVDGASQSSGCVVALYWDSTRGRLVETSTTTDFAGLSGAFAGVLYEGCQPNTMCKVITRGLVRIQTPYSIGAGYAVTTSPTRCKSSNDVQNTGVAACGNNICTGMTLNSPDANGYLWAIMYGP